MAARKVPFAKLWSPAFVPKPRDWPSEVKVVGSCRPATQQSVDESTDECKALLAWLADGNPDANPNPNPDP